MWYPGSLLLATDSLEWRYGHLRGLPLIATGLEVLSAAVNNMTILVINTSETGFGTRGKRWDAKLLIDNKLFVLKDAHNVYELFDELVV